jgi:hypothetical protein
MIFVVSILLLILYAFKIKDWKKNDYRLNQELSIYLKYLHYFTITITIILLILELQIKGIWTGRIVTFIALLSGIFYNLFAQKSVLNELEKTYFSFLSILPLIFPLFLLIPLFGMVIIFSTIGRLFSPYDKIHYDDKNLRIQTSFVGVLAPPKILVYKKGLFFEKEVENLNFPEEIDSLKVEYKKDSIYIHYWETNYDNQVVKSEIKISQ